MLSWVQAEDLALGLGFGAWGLSCSLMLSLL